MSRVCRPGAKPACAANKQLAPRIIVIVNVTTIFINLSRPAEASSISQLQHQQVPKNPAYSSHAAHMAFPGIHQDSAAPYLDRLEGDADSGQSKDQIQSLDTRQDQVTGGMKLANNLETNALIYLQRYGYMQASSNMGANNLISEDSFSNAISSFQKFAGIPETGVVDNQTWLYMQMPRCGNMDKTQIGGKGTDSQQPSGRSTRAQAPGIVRRRKRYALQGSKWRRQELTYRISQYPTRFGGAKKHEVDSQIERAFGIWSQVAPIDFVVKREGRVHIDIRFASGDHGDGDAFDGPGSTLAHAYFPQYGGDAHFDDQEYWTIDSYAGTNIFQVAAHELGHSLGLGHSNVREALMAPFYQKYKPNFKLHLDDILAIQALYGEKPVQPDPPLTSASASSVHHQASATPAPTTTTTTTEPAAATSSPAGPPANRTRPPFFVGRGNRGRPSNGWPKPALDGRETNDDEYGSPELPNLGGNGIGGAAHGSEDGLGNGAAGGSGLSPGAGYQPDLCADPSIDAVTRTEDGSSYIFKGDFYWMLTSVGLAKGYPRRISTDWDGLPGSLDAALTWADGKTFFFKGNKYWRFRNKRRDVGYPKLISAGFAGIPDDIDAAFVWSGNGRTYIFKGNDYWRFDSKADPPVSSEYPRSIKVWNGVPAHINAAFRWENNVTYFFKGSQYYRFNDKEFKVEPRGRPPFPRPSADWWFGCVSSNLVQRAQLSTSLREGLPYSPSPSTGGVSEASQDQGDWAFLAGLRDSTRIMGTHISDHNPEGPVASPADANDRDGIRQASSGNHDQEDTRYTTDNKARKINFYHPSWVARAATATVSSSAISLVHLNQYLVLSNSMLLATSIFLKLLLLS